MTAAPACPSTAARLAVLHAARCEILAADLRRARLMGSDRRVAELTRDLKAARHAQLRAELAQGEAA